MRCCNLHTFSAIQIPLSSYISELPDDQSEFDVTVKRYFTDQYNKIMKAQSDVYHYMNPYKTIPNFQKLLNGHHLHYLQFRVIKLKTAEDSYEYIITNLPHTFDPSDIKEIYHRRWRIETSFRYLKHANGLLHFHCRKPEFLKQEIYANLILYNFGIFLANEAAEENRKRNRKSGNKYRSRCRYFHCSEACQKIFHTKRSTLMH